MIRDVYVNNRVREIQKLTPPSHWYHCCGLDNPADLMTRGLLAEKLVNLNFWFNGPSNLVDPIFSIQDNDTPAAINETVNHELEDNLACLTMNHELEDNLACLSVQTVTPMFDVEKYNNIFKSLRIVGYVLRFINNCRGKRLGFGVKTSNFTTEDLDNAKTKLIYVIQREAFPSEIQALSNQRSVPKNSKLGKLDPFIDNNGLVRIKGRLQFSDLSYDSKHPVILPKGHFSKLLAQFQHKIFKACWCKQHCFIIKN